MRMANGLHTDQISFFYQPEIAQNPKSKGRVPSIMNPVYSPLQPGNPYGNPKNITYAGYPTGYSAAAVPQAYAHSVYHTGNAAFPQGYTAGTPYKVNPMQSTGAPPPYSPSANPYQMYPIRSIYPQQNLYAQQGAYYTQPVYAAAQPHVIHHTTVVQPNSLPSTLYPTQVPTGAPSPSPAPAPRSGALPMGMVSGTTMAMSTGTLLTTPQSTQHMGAQSVTMPTYRPQGAPGYSYVTPHW
ncbi:myelin-associated neurite-outgrowth inhibitor isoform X2 [Gadus morhua]|nr:myelin-associated neurite-outgrowth inhibitor-like isoform X2 [Gadus morhua]XP_056450318.1 myelin-associated neurite-outgrowth inhibitor-like isoform X2 [Gadus chalcogrammus]